LPTAGGVDPQPWPTLDTNGNAVISLTAGQRYPIQLWHVEGDSGRAEVTLKYSGEPDPANGAASRITNAYIGAFVDPTSLAPLITVQPTNIIYSAGDTLNFGVTVDSALPVTYQWYKNSAVITGQTNRTFTIANATSAAIGSYYVAVSSANGTVNSQVVTALTTSPPPHLSFQQDGTGTTVIEAEHYYEAAQAPDGHFWVPLADRAGYSGSGYMSVLPDSGVNLGNAGYLTNGARLDFLIQFATTGTNYIWLRGGDPRGDGAGDSVHAGLDGVSPTSATRIDGTPSFNIATGWNWVGNIQGDTRAYVVVTSAGIHTFSLWMREDGFSVDKLILTTDSAFTPTATGPAESQQAGGSSTLSIGRNASGAPVITYTGTLVSSPNLTGPYAPVSGASGGSYTVDVSTATQQFYRTQP